MDHYYIMSSEDMGDLKTLIFNINLSKFIICEIRPSLINIRSYITYILYFCKYHN